MSVSKVFADLRMYISYIRIRNEFTPKFSWYEDKSTNLYYTEKFRRKMIKIGGEISILDWNSKTKYIYSKFFQKYGKK